MRALRTVDRRERMSDPPGDRLAFGQDRHSGVVTVQPFGGHHVRFDQPEQRHRGKDAGADLVGQRRDRQIDAFAFEAPALTVER